MLRVIIIITTLSLSGCFPISHSVTVTPEINGVLLKSKVPIHNVTLYIAQTKDCIKTQEKTITDKNGKFQFQRTSKFQMYAAIMEHYNSAWYICYKDTQEKIINIYKGSAYSIGSAPDTQNIICDTEVPVWKGDGGIKK